MTKEEKTKYTKAALNLSGLHVHIAPEHAELIWMTMERLYKKGGKFTVRDGAKINARWVKSRKEAANGK